MPQNKQPLNYIDPYAQPAVPQSPTKNGYVDPYINQPAQPQQAPAVNYVDPYETQLEKITNEAKSIAQPILSHLSPAIDVLARGQYASARFFDSTMDQSKSFMDSAYDAFSELLPQGWVNPGQQKKLSFSDVIQHTDPNFAKFNPGATAILGFVGDVALDPLSYLGVGAGKNAAKVGGQALSKEGEALLKSAVKGTTTRALVGAEGTVTAVKGLESELAKPFTEVTRQVKGERALADKQAIKDIYKQIDKNTIQSDLPGLFNDMKSELPEKGIPGITKDTSDPEYLQIIHRNKDGNITGILTATKDLETGKLVDANIGVDPNLGKGLNSPVQKLGKAFLNEGYSFNDLMESMNTYTPSGAQLMKNVVDRTIYPQPKVATIVKTGGPNTEVVNQFTDELTKQGYFQAVKERSNELNNLISQASGQAQPELATNLAKQETLQDLLRKKVTPTLDAATLTNRVENRILSITNAIPEIRDKYFAPRGLYIRAGLPFGKQYDLFRVIGSDKAYDAVKGLHNQLLSAGRFGATLGKIEDVVGSTFNRNYNLPTEYVALRDDLENYLGYVNDETVRTTRKLFKDVDKEGRQRIGDTMQWIDDQSRHLEQMRGGADKVASDEYEAVVQRGMERAKLNPQEQALTAQLYQHYKEMSLIEMRAGLLKNNLVNYSPRGYSAILDPEDMTAIVRGKYSGAGGPNPYLSSSQQRKFATNAEAKAAGLDLELDASTLYANRALSSQRALATKQFKDSVESLFGTYVPNAEYAHTGILPTGVTTPSTLPRKVFEDMKMIGDASVPKELNSTFGKAVKIFDMLQNKVFKRGATVLRGPFAEKQLVANTFQSALISGIRAFKAFDPRVAAEAAISTFNIGHGKSIFPEYIGNAIDKFFSQSDAVFARKAVTEHIIGEDAVQDFASQYSRTTPFGIKWTGTDLLDAAREYGVFRGFDATGEGFTKKLETEISKDYTYWGATKELAKYWKHAAIAEDYNRFLLFINGITLGHSPAEASKLVNKALFDYSKGLSFMEKNVIKRLVPFYSYQRFAIPYVLKETLKQPGQVNTTQKFLKTVEKLISTGEPISEAEQAQVEKTFLWEQPALFKGFDKDGKLTFNVLNNLSPYDIFNFMSYDKEGNIDYGRTVEKSILGAVTPFIKVFLEYGYNYNIFTQKTVEEASKLGDLSQNISKVIPEPVKALIGWEDRTHMITGKKTSYMNPFMAYMSMNFFPVIKDYIKPLDGVPINNVSDALFGAYNVVLEQFNPARENKIDLKAQAEFEMLHIAKEAKDLQKDFQSAMIKGAIGRQAKDLEALRKLQQTMMDNAKFAQQLMRGQGMNVPVPEEGQEVIPQVPTVTPNIPQQFK